MELRVDEDSRANGLSLRELQQELEETIPVLAVVRDEKKRAGHAFFGTLREGDILLMEAGPEEMKLLEDKAGLHLGKEAEEESEEREGEEREGEEKKQVPGKGEEKSQAPRGKEEEREKEEKGGVDTEGLQLVEAVVRNDSMMVNRTVAQLRLHNQFGLHLSLIHI